MSVRVCRGDTDPVLDQFVRTLERYVIDHPRAKVNLYRQDKVSVRVRVIDPGFRGVERPDRHDRIWAYLMDLSEETLTDLSMLLPLAPSEVKRSFANMEFEDPVPSTF